jgi:nitrate/nitrite transporter NarK
LASHWFAPRHYAMASGMAILMGVIGGVSAGVPLRLLVEAFGWRPVMSVAAGLTALLSIVTWLLVRDDPVERGYASYVQKGLEHGEKTPILRGLNEVLGYRNIWIMFLTPVGVVGAILAFAGLWGVPYLRQVYALDAKSAALITSTLLVAWALGGPLLGAWSQRLGKRKPLYVLTTVIALAGWFVVVFLRLPLWLLVTLLVPVGFCSGNITIGFACAKESIPLRLTGTASGVCNMGPLLGGMLLQPGIGWLLDRHWAGQLSGGVRVYDAVAWQSGFMLICAFMVASLILISLMRETNCRQVVE